MTLPVLWGTRDDAVGSLHRLFLILLNPAAAQLSYRLRDLVDHSLAE